MEMMRGTDLAGTLVLGLCDDSAVAVHDGILLAFWTRGRIRPCEPRDGSADIP